MSEDVVVRLVTHTEPDDGVPEVADTVGAIADVERSLRDGQGPLAIDAERASGFRYGQRAYLLQFHRPGAGTHLVDPAAGVPLVELADFAHGLPWLLHAATQDLPCLREAGFTPSSVYDTELAARLLGREKVGLASLLEVELGVVLAKEHSAVDWSTRPLPQEWRAYAALDVEFLHALHALLVADLEARGRLTWYEQERALLIDFQGPSPRPEPWRRTSGIHALRDPRRLAIVRALWEARDARAQELDLSPGRVLHDSVIIDIAKQPPTSAQGLRAMRPVHNRNARKDPDYWWQAIAAALELSDADLPARKAAEGGLPQPRTWERSKPAAAERWERVRPAVVAAAEALGIAPEILIAPELVRRLCWEGLELGMSAPAVEQLLAATDARAWQREELTTVIAAALNGPRPAPEATVDQ